MNNRGQGLIEVVIAIGVIGLVITGIISLMVVSLHSRTSGFDRKKAAELGQVQIEQLLESKSQNPTAFWDRNSSVWTDYNGLPRVDGVYKNYSYTKNVSWGGSCPNCVEVTVGIGWSGSGVGETVTLSRLFSKN